MVEPQLHCCMIWGQTWDKLAISFPPYTIQTWLALENGGEYKCVRACTRACVLGGGKYVSYVNMGIFYNGMFWRVSSYQKSIALFTVTNMFFLTWRPFLTGRQRCHALSPSPPPPTTSRELGKWIEAWMFLLSNLEAHLILACASAKLQPAMCQWPPVCACVSELQSLIY